LLALIAFVSLCGAANVSQARADGYGTVTGQFVLEGVVPQFDPLVKAGDENVKDAAVCAKNTIPDERLVVDAESKGIANVFVFMPRKPQDIAPELKSSKESEVTFDQKGCRFIPHAMLVRTDQTVKILNGDPISHNTHVTPFANSGQNQIIQPNDRTGAVQWQFPIPERLATPVKCDIHPWMNANWLILDHPYAAITGKDGKFIIEKVPAGDQQFTAWQEGVGWVFGKARDKRSRKIGVKANETVDLGVVRVPASAFAK
jgi:hypothetical protein